MSIEKEAVRQSNRIEEFAREHCGEGRKKSAKAISFRCVFHEDTNPSMDVDLDKQVFCCRSCGAGGDIFTLAEHVWGVDFPEALRRLAERGGIRHDQMPTWNRPRAVTGEPTARPSRWRQEDIEREHLYRRDGVVVARKILLKKRSPDGKKEMQWERPDGRGGWVSGKGDVEPGLYRLDEAVAVLAKGGTLAIVEGEKDADALLNLHVAATSSPHGAMGAWREDYTAAIVAAMEKTGAARVRVFGDRDPAGDGRGRQKPEMSYYNATVIRPLLAAGLDARAVLWPEDSRLGFDVSDFLADPARGGRDTLRKMVHDALEWDEPLAAATNADAAPTRSSSSQLELKSLRTLLAEPDDAVEWVVQDRIPAGGVTVLAGKPKAGKSTLARDLALQVARGDRWLGFSCTQGTVWYLALEDKQSEVRKHFRAMGAQSDAPVHFVFHQPADDLVARLHALAAIEKPSLIIVDTLQRLIRARDLNDYAVITEKMTPLLTLCRATGAAMLLVHHAGKGDRVGIDAVLGSTALVGSADNILLFARTEDYRVLSSQQRIGPDLVASVVQFDEVAGRVSLGGTREDVEIAAIKTAMLGVLRDQVARTEKDLDGEVEGRTPLKRKALRLAVSNREIARTGNGKRSDPYLYSCSLVPAYIREQENKKPETAENIDKQALNSCSQKPALLRVAGRESEQAIPPSRLVVAPEVFEV